MQGQHAAAEALPVPDALSTHRRDYMVVIMV